MPQRIYGILLVLIAWAALALQLYLTDQSVVNFFSYFTILSNLLIAVSLTFALFAPSSGAGRFFSRLSVQSAIMLYIFIVALIYNLVLRGIWTFTGVQLVVDNVLHVVVPVLYIVYWLLFRTKGTLRWQDGIYWLYFPFAYLVYSLIRGAFIQWYPYPFLNATRLGYGNVFLNIAMIIAVFLAAGWVLIALNRSVKKSNDSIR